MKNKTAYIILFLLLSKFGSFAQFNNLKKKVRKVIKNENIKTETKIRFLDSVASLSPNISYKSYFPSIYFSNVYTLGTLKQDVRLYNIRNKSIIDTLTNIAVARRIKNNNSLTVQQRIKAINKIDTALLEYRKSQLERDEEINQKYAKLEKKTLLTKEKYYSFDKRPKRFLKRRFNIIKESIDAESAESISAVDRYKSDEKAKLREIDLAHNTYLEIIYGLLKGENEAHLEELLRQKKTFVGNDLLNGMKDDFSKRIDKTGIPNKDYIPEEMVMQRAGKNGEDLVMRWSLLLDTSFAFKLGEYKTGKIDYHIENFLLYAKDQMRGRILDIDFSFLGIADAKRPSDNLKYNYKLDTSVVTGYFRVGVNVNNIDTNIKLTQYSIDYQSKINNVELAILRCYNAYLVTRSLMRNSKGVSRYLHKDVISYEGDLKEKEGERFRRVGITMYIFNFFLIDKNGKKIAIEDVRKYDWQPENNAPVIISNRP